MYIYIHIQYIISKFLQIFTILLGNTFVYDRTQIHNVGLDSYVSSSIIITELKPPHPAQAN